MKPDALMVSLCCLLLAILSLAYSCPPICIFFALISGSLAGAYLWMRGLP